MNAESRTPEPHAEDRIRTGDAGADRILGGGFPQHTINLIMGEPGTGKTVFVEQLIFENATDDRPVLYLTTLSEPLPKMVRYLQSFDFFDENMIGRSVFYEDIGAALSERGVDVLVPRIRQAVREMSPGIIVIDSFKAVHDLIQTDAAARRLVHDLAGLLTAYETTSFLVGEYAEEDAGHYPEFAIADCVLQLSRRRVGRRDERYLSVFKLRGSGYREGTHAFRISERGLDVFPRFITPTAPQTYKPVLERVSTGLPQLDAMVGGGLWRGSTTLVAGPSGSGKTTLALHFALEGSRGGEPSLYLNFQENPTQLARTIRGFGIDLDEALGRRLDLLYNSSVELQIDSIIGSIVDRIENDGIRRIVIDAVGDLATAVDDLQRFHDYMYALIQYLTSRTVTTFLVMETGGLFATGPQYDNATPLSYMCDNLILLEMRGDERTRRTLRVIKTRASEHDPTVRDIEIRSGSIHIA